MISQHSSIPPIFSTKVSAAPSPRWFAPQTLHPNNKQNQCTSAQHQTSISLNMPSLKPSENTTPSNNKNASFKTKKNKLKTLQSQLQLQATITLQEFSEYENDGLTTNTNIHTQYTSENGKYKVSKSTPLGESPSRLNQICAWVEDPPRNYRHNRHPTTFATIETEKVEHSSFKSTRQDVVVLKKRHEYSTEEGTRSGQIFARKNKILRGAYSLIPRSSGKLQNKNTCLKNTSLQKNGVTENIENSVTQGVQQSQGPLLKELKHNKTLRKANIFNSKSKVNPETEILKEQILNSLGEEKSLVYITDSSKNIYRPITNSNRRRQILNSIINKTPLEQSSVNSAHNRVENSNREYNRGELQQSNQCYVAPAKKIHTQKDLEEFIAKKYLIMLHKSANHKRQKTEKHHGKQLQQNEPAKDLNHSIAERYQSRNPFTNTFYIRYDALLSKKP